MLSRTDCFKQTLTKILGTTRIFDKEVHKSNVVGSNLYLPTCCSLARFSNTTMYRDEYFSSHTTSRLGIFAEQKKRSSRIEYQISLEWTLLHILSDSKTKNLCWVLLPLKKTLRKFHKKYVLCTVCIGIRVTHCNRYPIALLTLEATQAKYWVALYFQQLSSRKRKHFHTFSHFGHNKKSWIHVGYEKFKTIFSATMASEK